MSDFHQRFKMVFRSPNESHPRTEKPLPAGLMDAGNRVRDSSVEYSGFSRLLEVNAALGQPIDNVVRTESLKFGIVSGSADFDLEREIQVVQFPLDGFLQRPRGSTSDIDVSFVTLPVEAMEGNSIT